MANTTRSAPRPSTRQRHRIGRPIPESTSSVGGAVLQPLSVLKRLHPNPISLLALFADHGGILSGSETIGGASTSESDWDLYQPDDPSAMIEAVALLQFAHVQWNNALLRRLEDVDRYGLAIVPYEEIYALAKEIILPQNWPLHELESYVKKVLEKSVSGPKFLADFPAQFRLALQECCTNLQQKEFWDGCREWVNSIPQKIWVYQPGQTDDSCTRQLPLGTTETVNAMLKILYDCPSCEVVTKDSFQAQARTLMAKHFLFGGAEQAGPGGNELDQRISIGEVKQNWKGMGPDERLMRKYLWSRMIKKRSYRRYEIAFLISLFFDMPWENRPRIAQISKDYDSAFRILRGRLPDGKKVQLIFVPIQHGGIIRTVLKFYATHVMSFIGGTFGAHLYHDTAKRKVTHTFDFSHDCRQRLASQAIKKYRQRGWTIKKVPEKTTVRMASDKRVLMEEYENIYKSSLRSVGRGDGTLPDWWDDYFMERRTAFQSYTWYHIMRRVTRIHNCRERLTSGPKLLDWVHRELDGDDQVIPKAQWEGRNTMHAALDLWFGGIRMKGESSSKYCLL